MHVDTCMLIQHVDTCMLIQLCLGSNGGYALPKALAAQTKSIQGRETHEVAEAQLWRLLGLGATAGCNGHHALPKALAPGNTFACVMLAMHATCMSVPGDNVCC